ncbi:glucose-6-phosphate dehydrogenase [bacterium]|nr:glucose-6-phosphate dehydrogenase [bacterium]
MENPLRAGIRLERTAGPCSVVIFGASGDLTKRKLMPALYSLLRQNLLPGSFYILGAARTEMNDEAYRKTMREAITEFADEGIGDETLWQNFASRLFYLPIDPDQPDSTEKLKKTLEKLDGQWGTEKNKLLYLSIPPNSFSSFIRMLESAGLNRSDSGWIRIIIEKPFGRDLESARALNREILRVFREEQIYRIDHYLGKETVQNIMVLRFANGIFEPLWNRRYIDHIQITAAESIGVENRGTYYEQAGAFRDMIQNHMLQLLTLVAMEPPVAMEAEAVRDEKTKVLRAMRPMRKEDVPKFALRAQYAEGATEGEAVHGYRSESNVKPSSQTETFAAIKLFIDNWRWAEVPFYLRSGKRLPRRVTEIAIQYKRVPHLLFQEEGEQIQPNFLIMRIQPDEGISLKFGAKFPGQQIRIRQVSMDFQYGTSFGRRSPEAYERLLLDAMLGDSTLYARGDFVELSWQHVMPILEAWKDPAIPLATYPAGSWGPPEADEFMERDGRRWRRP